MNAQTILDHIIFQLTPTRTRCELFVVAGDVTERLTSGLLKPFLSHLLTAEEQLATGGYSIKLEPGDHSKASWFTKGTAERFVRFVSSPDVVERVNTIETELVQLEETIRMQNLTSTRVEDPLLADSPSISLLGEKTLSSSEKPRLLKKMRQDSIDSNDSGVSKNSKKQLLRALDARRLVLQKEQGMAFARAAAAGYELVHLLQLIMFSDCFGAARLREACFSFVALCRKRQIIGFCAGDTKIIDQDLTWALSNTACSSILKSMEEVSPMERIKEEDIDGLRRAVKPSLHDEKGYQQNLPAVHVNLSPASQVHEWSSPTDVFQGWPEMYASRNNPYAMFQGYQYGFSPCTQESFTTLPSMSPSDATELFGYPMGVLSQQPPKTQKNLQMSSSPERQPLPPLRKLHVGHRGMQKRSRMAGRDINSKESHVHFEKHSSDVTDSSTERSDLLKAAPVVLQDMGRERNRRSDSSDLSDSIMETEVPSFRATSSGGSSSTVRQNKETAHLDRSFALHQRYDAVHEKDTSRVQVSKRTATSDDSLVLFEQCQEGSLGSKPKKRLDFQEPEVYRKQQLLQQESKSLDDSFYVYSPPVNREQRTQAAIESELQSNQIYARMSKQALKVNSGVSHQHDPDDLLMMPGQRKRAPARNSSDVMDIDIELLGSASRHANLLSSQKASMGPEPSQERVKKFLDQYNEKREAKLRGEVSSSKRAEREGKLKSLTKDLEKRKSEMAKPRRPERTTLQAEAQVRADKLRSYKAGLQKIKKEKEEEEKRRLEALKAQRQERIAARSNPTSSIARGRMSSPLPTSKLSPASRLLPPQKCRSSMQVLRSSTQKIGHSRQLDPNRTPPRSSRSFSNPGVNQLRSSTPSVRRQTGRASIGSQPSTKTETKGAQSTKTPSARTNNLFSAVFGGRENQMSRTSSIRKSEPSSITSRTSSIRKSEPSSIPSNKQGFISGSRSGLPLERSVKGLTSKAGKDLPRSMGDMKPEGRTFLKKGSGAMSSGRSVQKTKSTIPGKVKAADKRPLFSPDTRSTGMKILRLDTKEASQLKLSEGGDGVSMSRPTGVRINSSTLKEASRMKVSEGGAGVATSSPTVVKSKSSTSPGTDNGSLRANSTGKGKINDQARGSDDFVNLDSESSIPRYSDDKRMATSSYSTLQPMSSSVLQENHMPSIPRYSHDKETATSSYSTLQPMSSTVLEKNHMPSEGGISSLLLHKGPPVESAMSRLMLFDRTCTVSGDSNKNKHSIIFDTISPTESAYRESTISSGNAAKQESTSYSSIVHTPRKQQSNGFGKLLRFGQRSIHSPASEGDHDTESYSSDATSNHGRLSLNGFIHPSQSSKKQSKAAVLCQGSDSSFTAKASRPFSFLGTFRSKAAEAKWR